MLPPGGPVAESTISDRCGTRSIGLRGCGVPATLEFTRASGELEIVDLEPTLTFRMRGAGYSHPVWGHGRWHDELVVGGETHRIDELDSLDPSCLHVQQVVRARWGARTGIGVLEQAVLGPHAPSGFTGYTDGGAEA
jgi:hypothetical protein